MKGSTQPMKRLLVLLPLLLVGCTNDKISDNSHTISNDKVFYNVSYSYYYEKHCYLVAISEDDYHYVPPKNYYHVEIDTYEYNETAKGLVLNEYFVNSNELFVYIKK